MKFLYASGSRPLAGYTIKRGIGKGGFGEVYFATSDAGKEVALKHVERNLDVELRGVGQCLNLKHLNLIDLYDIRYDDEGEAWVVMEYVAGQNLKEALDRNPHGLPRDEAERWFRGIAAGVGHLHEHGIVHRDLKPGNIFDDGGVVKIGDYGLSKFISCSRRGGQTESVGTFHYMAPEIGNGSYGKEIDIYALGIILFELLTGKVPFEGESSQEIIMKHLTADPDLSPVPPPFRAIVEKSLHKDPGQRFHSVGEMLAMLDAPAASSGARDKPAPQPETAAPSKLAGAKLAEAVLAGRAPPHYIGDDDQGMNFGPVKPTPRRLLAAVRAKLVPPVRAAVPGSFAALNQAPRTQEPIAQAVGAAGQRFANWWNEGTGGTPAKMVVLLALAAVAVVHGGWLVPAGIMLGGLYLVYLGVWTLVQPASAAAASAGQAIEEQCRAAIRGKTRGDRMGELAGSMLAASGVTAILTIATVLLSGDARWLMNLSQYAWLWLAATLGAWLVLAAGKFWESRSGEGIKRRFVQVLLGLALGGMIFAASQFLLVSFDGSPLQFASPPRMTSTGGESEPARFASVFLAYFAALFATIGWWKQTDPLRGSRLRIWPVLVTLAAALLWNQFWSFPAPWSFLIAGGISIAVQLSSPWITPRERQEISQRGSSALTV